MKSIMTKVLCLAIIATLVPLASPDAAIFVVDPSVMRANAPLYDGSGGDHGVIITTLVLDQKLQKYDWNASLNFRNFERDADCTVFILLYDKSKVDVAGRKLVLKTNQGGAGIARISNYIAPKETPVFIQCVITSIKSGKTLDTGIVPLERVK